MGGLVHDYAYKYACLKRTGKGALLIVDQKADEIFRDICIEVNGFYTMNYLHNAAKTWQTICGCIEKETKSKIRRLICFLH